jgi:hypothetical protein
MQQEAAFNVMDKRKLGELIEQIDRVDRLCEADQLAEPREILLAAQADCARAGIESAFLKRRLCVVCGQMQERELAFKYVQEALRMDPLAPPFRNSFGIIVATMRNALLAAQREPSISYRGSTRCWSMRETAMTLSPSQWRGICTHTVSKSGH